MDKCLPVVLETKGIHKGFSGVPVLRDINFAVRRGSVHALVGENGAGKSTLMKILSGIHPPDRGTILLDGKEITDLNPQKSIALGISMIHQELNPVPYMTIAENIFLGREPGGRLLPGFVDYRKLAADTREILERMQIPYDPGTRMNDLSLAGKQLIEIAKAISRNASIIIMDEPTSSLTDTEAEVLFRQIAELKSKQVAVVYITHKMDEIFGMCDTITVLRDGALVDSGPTESFTMDSLITKMVGREVSTIFPKETVPIGDVVFEASHLTRSGVFQDVSFSVRRGEILGLAGLVGAGRTEVVRAIFGLDKLDDGQVTIDGETLTPANTWGMIGKGVAMIPEDRKDIGLVLCRSIRENISVASLEQIQSHGFLNLRAERRNTDRMVEALGIKVSSVEHIVASLSGGNQQKVVLAKWLLRNIKLLILDEPTRGIDVGAKSEIHRMMCELAGEGMAIIMISSELPEILGMSDRVLVMHGGRITGELGREEATQESIMRYAVRDIAPCAGAKEEDAR